MTKNQKWATGILIAILTLAITALALLRDYFGWSGSRDPDLRLPPGSSYERTVIERVDPGYEKREIIERRSGVPATQEAER